MPATDTTKTVVMLCVYRYEVLSGEYPSAPYHAVDLKVYFSIEKGYLKLRTECHSTSYDVITAHMVIMAIRYMILVVTCFENTNEREIEEIMNGVHREAINRMMDCAVILIIDTLLDSISECFGTTEDQINRLVYVFISKFTEA